MTERLTRRATLKWTTNPPGGVGRVSVASSAFAALPISLAEAEPNPREATPGERCSPRPWRATSACTSRCACSETKLPSESSWSRSS